MWGITRNGEGAGGKDGGRPWKERRLGEVRQGDREGRGGVGKDGAVIVVVVVAAAGKAVAELNSSLLVNYRHENETGNQVAFMQIKKTTLRP